MKLIVGLGNPGKSYENTRHNIGFMIIDHFANTTNWKNKWSALYTEIIINNEKVLLIKPQTFMNLSGNAVGQAARFYRLPPSRVLVLCDDISLDPGRLRVRAGGSAGGHNGLKSIINQLGSQEFPRVKIGVGGKPHPDYDLADWVLSSFSQQEEKSLAPVWEQAGQAALTVVDLGVEQAAGRFNGIGR